MSDSKQKVILVSFSGVWFKCPKCYDLIKCTNKQSRNIKEFIGNHRFCSKCGVEMDWSCFLDLIESFNSESDKEQMNFRDCE